jgi:hypothetical protein
MDIRSYFEKTEGTGILATSDFEGNVDTALYARPHFMDDGTLAFIMAENQSYHNLNSNPRASYLFIEKNPKEKRYEGKRLYLKMLRDEQNKELISSLRRNSYGEEKEGRHIVFFEIVRLRPLVGD